MPNEFRIIPHKRRIRISLFLCIIERKQTLSVVLFDMLIQFLNKSFLNLSSRAKRRISRTPTWMYTRFFTALRSVLNDKLLLFVTQSDSEESRYTHEDVHEILPPFGRLDDKQLLFVTQSEAKSLEYTHEDVHEILPPFGRLDDKQRLFVTQSDSEESRGH